MLPVSGLLRLFSATPAPPMPVSAHIGRDTEPPQRKLLARQAREIAHARAGALLPIPTDAIGMPSAPAVQMPGNRTPSGAPLDNHLPPPGRRGGARSARSRCRPSLRALTRALARERRPWRLTVLTSQCRRSETRSHMPNRGRCSLAWLSAGLHIHGRRSQAAAVGQRARLEGSHISPHEHESREIV